MIKNKDISVITIPQLSDNYSYLIKSKDKKIIVVDPAEAEPIINYVVKNNFEIQSILLTHHHNDHTSGVEGILNYKKLINVYSPSNKINFTTNVVGEGSLINLDLLKVEVISTPGHTLDHIVYYNDKHKLLFSGDSIFRLGCGRIFEGTKKQMYESLEKIKSLDDRITVYCGHEYTMNNLKFLKHIFPKNKELDKELLNIESDFKKFNRSIPLGREKEVNPFLSTNSNQYQNYKMINNFDNFSMFSHLRQLKDSF